MSINIALTRLTVIPCSNSQVVSIVFIVWGYQSLVAGTLLFYITMLIIWHGPFMDYAIVLIIIGYIGYCVVFLRLSSQAGVLASRTDGVRAENALGDGRGRSPKQENNKHEQSKLPSKRSKVYEV